MEPSKHSTSRVADARLIDLPRHRGDNGSLTVIENSGDMPFLIKRVYYIYDVPTDEGRGGHSHHALEGLMVALSGSFTVTLDDGKDRRVFTLDRPYRALYIPAGIWRTVENFSSGAICMVAASDKYDAADYVRDYSEFKKLTSDK